MPLKLFYNVNQSTVKGCNQMCFKVMLLIQSKAQREMHPTKSLRALSFPSARNNLVHFRLSVFISLSSFSLDLVIDEENG